MLLLSRNEELLKINKNKKNKKAKITSLLSNIRLDSSYKKNSHIQSNSNISLNSMNIKNKFNKSKSTNKLYNKNSIMIRSNNINFEKQNRIVNLSNSHSQKSLSLNFRNLLKIPNLFQFHQSLMSKNFNSYYKRLSEDINDINNLKLNSFENNSFHKKEDNKQIDNNKEEKNLKNLPYINLINYLKGRSKKFQFEKEYNKKIIDKDIKNIIKEELYFANEKIKKPKINIITKRKPYFLQSLEKDKCIGVQNPLLEINQIANLPEMVDDGDLMFKLFNSGFEKCNNKKYKIKY